MTKKNVINSSKYIIRVNIMVYSKISDFRLRKDGSFFALKKIHGIIVIPYRIEIIKFISFKMRLIAEFLIVFFHFNL